MFPTFPWKRCACKWRRSRKRREEVENEEAYSCSLLSHNLLSGRGEGNTVWMVWLEAVTPKHQIDLDMSPSLDVPSCFDMLWLSLILPNYDFSFSMLLRSSNLPTCKFKSFYSLHKSSPKIQNRHLNKIYDFYPAIYLPNPLLRSPKSVSDFLFLTFFRRAIFLLSHEWSWSLCTLHAFWMCEELAHQGSTSTPTSSSKRFLASEGFEVWRHALHAPGKLWFILFATCRRLTRNVILWKQSYEYYESESVI